jgi:hypothetical protein
MQVKHRPQRHFNNISPLSSLLNIRQGQPRQAQLQVFITSAIEGSTAYYAVVIYAGRKRVAAFSDWLDKSTAERAWLHAYQMACEFRDENSPDARFYTIKNINDL